jgi:hypothetical protein
VSNLDELLNEPVVDLNQLQEEFIAKKALAERAAELEIAQKERPLTKEEQEFLAGMPAVYRRAIEITRILRRTNTGPAKVKTPSKRASSKAAATAKAASLLNDL